ncbi:SMC-Scp complex subunit ScpB [Sanguibacter sp. 25GB23B1]|uniref:SMC-Scp complex subunit ScpB n=1 Tax=unclassified Sanguibacter TaxID=2645534 RepID=UPI0032AF8621
MSATHDEPGAGPDVRALPGGVPAAIEAILMVTDEPVSAVRLATALAVPVPEVEASLRALSAEYSGRLVPEETATGPGGDAPRRPAGFELREAGGGWRIYSAPAFADVVARFVTDGQTARLTQAALETLAVIAYRQPVTRGQVSAVRGVNVDGVVRTLSARGLVTEVGTEAASGALLYGTTGYFMERMGFSSLDELPALAPHLPEIDALEGFEDVGPRGRDDRWAGWVGGGAHEQPVAPELEDK